MFFDFFFDKHHQKSDEKKSAGNPYRSHAKQRDTVTADTCADGKKKDDTPVTQGFMQCVSIAGSDKSTQGVCSASDIADAHSAGKGVTIDFTETLYLHGTGKGNNSIGQQIKSGWQKSHSQQKKDFKYKNQLPPVNTLDTLKSDMNTFGNGDAKGKK